MNIRQKINLLTKDPDTLLLEKAGIVSEFGNLTGLGRRVVLDLSFTDEVKAAVIEKVKAVNEAEKAAKEA